MQLCAAGAGARIHGMYSESPLRPHALGALLCSRITVGGGVLLKRSNAFLRSASEAVTCSQRYANARIGQTVSSTVPGPRKCVVMINFGGFEQL